MKRQITLLLTSLTLTALPKAAFGNRIETMRGIATKEGQTKPLYFEYHTIRYQGDKLQTSVTQYKSPKGDNIALLSSDYTRSLMLPTYLFEDLRRGYKEGLRWQKGQYYIFFQNPGEAEKIQPLEDTKGVFSGQGWHHYIMRNIDKIGTEGIELKLLFPGRLDYYGFDLNRNKQTESEVQFILSFSNWFLKAFTPELTLRYQKQPRKLVYYRGPSNIAGIDGEIQNVVVTYPD